jgi:hypothetical protein
VLHNAAAAARRGGGGRHGLLRVHRRRAGPPRPPLARRRRGLGAEPQLEVARRLLRRRDHPSPLRRRERRAPDGAPRRERERLAAVACGGTCAREPAVELRERADAAAAENGLHRLLAEVPAPRPEQPHRAAHRVDRPPRRLVQQRLEHRCAPTPEHGSAKRFQY